MAQYKQTIKVNPVHAQFIKNALTMPGFLARGETYTVSAYFVGQHLDFCYAVDKRVIGRGKGKTAWVETVLRKMNPDSTFTVLERSTPADEAEFFVKDEEFAYDESPDYSETLHLSVMKDTKGW